MIWTSTGWHSPASVRPRGAQLICRRQPPFWSHVRVFNLGRSDPRPARDGTQPGSTFKQPCKNFAECDIVANGIRNMSPDGSRQRGALPQAASGIAQRQCYRHRMRGST